MRISSLREYNTIIFGSYGSCHFSLSVMMDVIKPLLCIRSIPSRCEQRISCSDVLSEWSNNDVSWAYWHIVWCLVLDKLEVYILKKLSLWFFVNVTIMKINAYSAFLYLYKSERFQNRINSDLEYLKCLISNKI